MKSQTSLVARQFRLQTWTAQIQDCQNRPEGMSVEDWCLQNNITKANYYYRLKRIRQACLDSMQPTEPSFVELRPADTPLLETTEPEVPAEAVDNSAKNLSFYWIFSIVIHRHNDEWQKQVDSPFTTFSAIILLYEKELGQWHLNSPKNN